VEVTLPSEEEREARNTDPAPPPDVSSRPDPEDEETVRVDARAVTQLIPHVEKLAAFRESITAHGRRARDLGRRVRQTRADVLDGDGADTERNLGALADELDTIANELRESADRFGGDVLAAKRQVSGILLTTMGTVFARIVGVVDAEARRLSRLVRTRAAGIEEPVDRRLAERLVEPCVQIARNAVAHGIQSPEQRRAAGKDPSSTITLTAKRVGARLQVTIADDGGGVDLTRVREHAIATGVLDAERAATADDAFLLSLLLRPGFTTQSSADLLAGRGIGLDIALHGIQRLGGSLRLLSRRGEGFSARIEFPVEAALGGVRIEPLRETDLESAAAIVEPSAGRDELIVPAKGLPEARRLASQTRLREELARPWARVRIARALTGDLLGVLVAWHVADEVHILDVVTDIRARRRGIGRALMNDLLTFARALPVRHLLLEVRRSNTPAIQLYRTLGFFATNVRKRYYDDGEDAVEMRLVFDEAREVVFAPDEFPVEAP
jgi:ribosomal protein S18 acetylase RimI-like enzyme